MSTEDKREIQMDAEGDKYTVKRILLIDREEEVELKKS